MSCVYSNWEGYCSLYNEDNDVDTSYINCPMGWDEIGACCVEDDPTPSNSCESYEPN